ncbi:ABC transporter permease, partial [Enterococcus faecalis]|uniref:ABC transporter permease n=1 Tax=Enterococcus faecalis TaxID=1351 RepID=UPI003CC5D56E
LLKYVFQVKNLFLTLILVLVIVSNAPFKAKKRSQQLQKGFLISFIAIGCSTGISIGILIFSGSIKLIPTQIIPISGMI